MYAGGSIILDEAAPGAVDRDEIALAGLLLDPFPQEGGGVAHAVRKDRDLDAQPTRRDDRPEIDGDPVLSQQDDVRLVVLENPLRVVQAEEMIAPHCI
jgi:hypothetical protein